MYLRASILYESLSTAGERSRWAILATVLFFGSVPGPGLAHALVSPGPRDPGPGHHPVLVSAGWNNGPGWSPEGRATGRLPDQQVVGPLTSGLLAALFGVTCRPGQRRPVRRAGRLAGTLGYLAWTNLADWPGSNLLPGFPLDGGRLLRLGHLEGHRQLRAGNPESPRVAGQVVGWLLSGRRSGPGCWPETSPAASGSPSSAGSWSRPPGSPPTRISSCGPVAARVEAEDVMAGDLRRIRRSCRCRTPWTTTSCAMARSAFRSTSRGGRDQSAC